MTTHPFIPEFAILGHPNEGKSAVVSTLTENDQVRVSPVPGETTRSSSYTVYLDNTEVIRFTDTPGFQVPQQTLAWFKAFKGNPESILDDFIQTFRHDPFYADECELFRPVAAGAGIIYVVDGSRPVRDDDLAEIEILRLTGRPRMAIINSKTSQNDYSREWKNEFSKTFNAIRRFNANLAGFSERTALLESLKAIDQEWEAVLSRVISAFRSERAQRCALTAAKIVQALEKAIGHTASAPLLEDQDAGSIETALKETYQTQIRQIEQEMFTYIRSLFRHRLYDYPLPECSLLSHDLFSKKTWEVLGLTPRQLAGAGAMLGGSMGAALDVAAAGITFGVFTAIGSALGAGSAVLGSKKIIQTKKSGFRLGSDRIIVGPSRNIQLLYVLMDRALLFSEHMANRAHGRRDLPETSQDARVQAREGYTTRFSDDQKKICAAFFKVAARPSAGRNSDKRAAFQDLLTQALNRILGPGANL